MPDSSPLPPFRGRPALLLALGLLAVFLHLLAGGGMARAVSADGIAIELCTSHGLVKLDPGQGGGDRPAGAAHDCCKLCAAGAALLPPGHGLAVSPAPTFVARPDRFRDAQRSRPPLHLHAARGPPASA